jgi:hypothetical protein
LKSGSFAAALQMPFSWQSRKAGALALPFTFMST